MHQGGQSPKWYTGLGSFQTKDCTGVMERVGEPARSEDDEAERLVTSRCNSSTLFCSSARLASRSL